MATAEKETGLDIREKSYTRDGQVHTLDRRLFMQLHAWGGARRIEELVAALEQAGIEGVLYQDVADPQGVALLTMSEDPESFVGPFRQLLLDEPFVSLEPRPELTMFGRTYAVGYEPDLEEALLRRPRAKALDPEHRWVVWYPLRRSGTFEQSSEEEQREMMVEHGNIGMAFGRAGLATDIRLACHGLDRNDNDFVVGLVGRDLYPLSAVVQQMRKTKQTAIHLERLGPFFVGRVVWQSPRPEQSGGRPAGAGGR